MVIVLVIVLLAELVAEVSRSQVFFLKEEKEQKKNRKLKIFSSQQLLEENS